MFCRNCAEVLTDTDVTCPRCGFATGSGIKYCEQCGDPLAIGAAVCPTCGNRVTPPAMQMPQGGFMQQPQQGFAQAQAQQGYAQQPNFQQQPQGGYLQQPQTGFVPQPNPMAYGNVQLKSKVAAGILGILLGAFGVHNFYLGKTGRGVVQLLMTLCSCGVLSFVSGIWGLVEGIMILTGNIKTDGRGLPLKD